MNKNIVLGIDTSNYTTSIALISDNGELIANIKYPLSVKQGERGLRQSDALFAHIKNLPFALEDAENILAGRKICAVGVSERPRNVDGSYMPCFLAGVNAAKAASVASGVPLFKFSHQCGHIMAAIYSSGDSKFLDKEFAAFHISGGTTELLRVKQSESGFNCEHIGGSRDLNAGQVIDRIGVALELSFPAGRELEALALSYEGKIPKRKISRDGMWVNLSGLENMALKIYSDNNDKALTAAFIFDYLGRAIYEMSEAYEEKFGKTHFVYAGGVMCNTIIKDKLKSHFECSFAEPAMSADNAVGIACLAKKAYDKSGR